MRRLTCGRRRSRISSSASPLPTLSTGSVSATCQRHAVGSGLLYTWRRQALAGDLTGAKRTPAPSFAEVEVSVPAPATAGSGHIGIELPSGVRLTVDAAVDTDALARVMSVLAR